MKVVKTIKMLLKINSKKNYLYFSLIKVCNNNNNKNLSIHALVQYRKKNYVCNLIVYNILAI